MRKNLHIGSGIIFVLLLIGALWFFSSNTTFIGSTGDGENEITPTEDPLDVTINFYNDWVAALVSTTTDPYQAGLATSSVLSEEVKAYIEEKRINKKDGDFEAVTCQLTTPPRVGGKEIYKKDTEAQIMILARGQEVKTSNMAIVTLKAKDGLWQISNINCTQGEIAPITAYDFEHSGFLLKQSLPAPFDSQYWHLVYEEVDGQTGYTVRLYFTPESICISKEGSEAVCSPDSFTEATKAFVEANMTEEGGVVERMRFE